MYLTQGLHRSLQAAPHALALAAGSAATGEELAAFCKGHIAGCKVPRSFEFRDAQPTSGAGKILKRELRESHAAAQAPVGAQA